MGELWSLTSIVLWLLLIGVATITMGTMHKRSRIPLPSGSDLDEAAPPEWLAGDVAAPVFQTSDVWTNDVIDLGTYRGRRIVLVFLEPTCGACRHLVGGINDVAKALRANPEIVAVCHGSKITCQRFARNYRLDVPIALDSANEIARAYEVQMLPLAVLIDETGIARVRRVVTSSTHLCSMINASMSRPPAGASQVCD